MKFFRNIVLSLITIFFFYFSFYPHYSGFLIFFALIPMLILYRYNPFIKGLFYITISMFIFYFLHYKLLTYVWNLKIVSLMEFYIALYYTLWFILLKIFKIKFDKLWDLFFAAGLFAILEIVRGNLLGGWPGCSLATGLYRFLPFIQIADVGGVYFISFLIVLINLMIYAFLFEQRSKKLLLLTLLVLIFVFNIVYGVIKINKYHKKSVSLNTYFIQPSIEQRKKWNTLYALADLKNLNNLLKKANGELIILPETTVPNDFTKFRLTKETLMKYSKNYILFGSEYYDDNYFYDLKHTRKHNCAFLIKNNRIIATYVKLKPVPFAEYSPTKWGKRLLLSKEIIPGNEYTVFKTIYGQFAVNICFESIFPELSRHFVKNGANLLINISNEAWFGHTPISMELLSLSIFRTIELRRDFIKVSNTGISAYVNSYGKIVMKTKLFQRTEGRIRVNLRNDKTLFLFWGYWFLYVLTFIFFILRFFQKKEKKVILL